jgi:hypothetical protein
MGVMLSEIKQRKANILSHFTNIWNLKFQTHWNSVHWLLQGDGDSVVLIILQYIHISKSHIVNLK